MAKNQVTIPVFIPHMGCPHRCAFCNQWKTSGAQKPPDTSFIQEQVARYTSMINKSVSRVELAFFGGSFTGISEERQAEFLEAVQPYRMNGTIQAIRLSTRPDYIDEKKLDLLEKFGVTTIELGAQSFFDDILRRSCRGHLADDTIHAAQLITKRGFELVMQLMPGLPGDTMEFSVESARRAAGLNPSAARIYPTVVMAGTQLADMYNSGEYSPLSLEEAVETCKAMYLVFSGKNIPVIRLGLHPLSPEESRNIITGPYHPAFGFLVKSRLRRDELYVLMKENIKTAPILNARLSVPSLNSEEYIGLKKENIDYLKNIFNLERLEYRVEKVPAPSLILF